MKNFIYLCKVFFNENTFSVYRKFLFLKIRNFSSIQESKNVRLMRTYLFLCAGLLIPQKRISLVRIF